MQWSFLVAQGVPVVTQPAPPAGLWGLFTQSFDVFTVLLLAGSLVGVALVFLAIFEIRARNIVPRGLAEHYLSLARAGRLDELRDAAWNDESFVSRVVRAALPHAASNTGPGDRVAMREAAELAASEESAFWFRKIDLLSVIGNLGPLVGLAGTVWGMILAFTSLGASGGTAGPADLSLGISKALFHTLLGLCLAIPCLLAYGIFRGRIDRMCTRGIIEASEIVEALPVTNATPHNVPTRYEPSPLPEQGPGGPVYYASASASPSTHA